MQDFLLFKIFLSPTILLIIYYIGALLVPIVSWIFAKWIHVNYASHVVDGIKNVMTSKQRVYLVVTFIVMFFMMEVFWRMMFEFLIAYFNIHDALMHKS